MKAVAKKIRQDAIFEQLTRLPNGASSIRFLIRHRLLSPVTVKQLDEAVTRLVRIDLDRARRLSTVAVNLARSQAGDALAPTRHALRRLLCGSED